MEAASILRPSLYQAALRARQTTPASLDDDRPVLARCKIERSHLTDQLEFCQPLDYKTGDVDLRAKLAAWEEFSHVSSACRGQRAHAHGAQGEAAIVKSVNRGRAGHKWASL